MNNKVLWIGGSAAGGKTSIAKRIAEEFGFHYYDGDGKTAQRLKTAPVGSARHRFFRATIDPDECREFFDQDAESFANERKRS